MNKKKQIRKELKNYLDSKLEKGDLHIFDEVVNFIKKDRKKQLTLTDVVDSEERTELPAPTIPEFGTDEWIDCCEQLFGGMRKSR